MQWIGRYKYGNIDDVDYQKEIIDTFLNSIYVYDDRLVFTYNYRDGTETLTLKDIEAAFGSDMKNCSPPLNPNRKVRIFVLWGNMRIGLTRQAIVSPLVVAKLVCCGVPAAR